MKLTSLMNKYLLAFISIILLTNNLFAQQSSAGLSLWNQHLIIHTPADAPLQIIVKGDKAAIQQLCKKYQATFLYNIHDLCRVSISKKNVEAFALESAVSRIGDFSVGGKTMLDTARIWNNVDSAYQGIAPLTQSYTGSGVLFGLIDDGIYFDHPDFKNPDSTTRIKFLWDQNYAPSVLSPLPYNYGKEWNYIDINNDLCTHVEQGSAGHGTHVTGIAVGNGNANPAFRGNAPACDIVAVSVKYGTDFLTNMIDAVDYIYKKADAMGRPCVINTSVGDYYGARDGKDLTSVAIDYLLQEKSGRILVAAAGNAGNIAYHGHYNFSTGDSLYSFFTTKAYTTKYYFDFWADTQSFNNAYFTVEAIDTIGYFRRGNTGYINIKRDMPTLPFVPSVIITRNIIDSVGSYRGQVKYAAQLVGTTYHIECEVTPDTFTKVWSLRFAGQGKADVWASKSLITTSNFVYDTALIAFPGYVYPDNNQTIVSSWQCSNNVITVGNYVNRNAFLNFDSTYTFNTETAGNIAQNSSWGPTRDGRTKPDITAPGNFVMSCMSMRWFSTLVRTGQSYKIAYGGYYVRNSGTSMASPMVAGAVALLLEKYPNLKPFQAKDMLFRTARLDSFTTNSIPNNTYGYGKLNTYQSLLYPAVFGCMDTTAFNYNPSANISNDSCIAKVYGCMDSTALNYNPLANTVSVTDTCVYAVIGSVHSLQNQTQVQVFPNPAFDKVIIACSEMNQLKHIRIMELSGRTVYTETLEASQNQCVWNSSLMARGIYLYEVKIGTQTITGKITLQ